MRRPLAIAVTGGIAAGKSEALKAFAEHGAAVVSSDEIVHRLLQTDEEVRAALRERWGDDIFTFTGDVDRPAVAQIVFRDRAELDWLEQLLHPKTRAAADAWLATVDALLAAVEIPLLYETGGEERFDAVVVVTAPPEVRDARRDGLAERETRLIPDEEKIARADFGFVNDGSLDELDAFVGQVVEELCSS